MVSHGCQDKEIYRWPIKESIKAMLAWEWTIEKAREGDEEKVEQKTSTRKVSHTAQVRSAISAPTAPEAEGLLELVGILYSTVLFLRPPTTLATDTTHNQ